MVAFKGTVKLIFQPAEEGKAGAYHMLQEGALEKVQAIFGLHVNPHLQTGAISSRPGPILAASGRFLAVIQGKGGHAADPHQSTDPVLAASSAILSLQPLVSREADPLDARVRLFSSLLVSCSIGDLVVRFSLLHIYVTPSLLYMCIDWRLNHMDKPKSHSV